MNYENKILETDRLILSEYTHDDAEFIFLLLNSPGWLQFIGDRGIKNLDDARKYISDKLIASYRDNGFGLFKITLKEKNIPIGMCGLIKREGLDDIDIGFSLAPGFMSRGYAFEAADATMKYAKDILKINSIVAITLPGNTSSINLLKKLNFNFEKMIRIPNDPEDLMLFANK